MTKLTKTERLILKEAAASTKLGVSRTVDFKNRGIRGVGTIEALYRRGLLDGWSRKVEKDTHRGIIRRYMTITAYITKAGREALR